MQPLRKLRIAQIAPIFESVPPKRYGGTERVVFELTQGLVKRGHAVTLFASGDSSTLAKLIPTCPRSLRRPTLKVFKINDYLLLNSGLAYTLQNQFDVIHDHTMIGLPTANIAAKPVIMTWHGPFTETNRLLFATFTKPYVIAVSHAQAYMLPERVFATIYNGLTLAHYPFSNTRRDYLLFVGRISPQKGVHYAIETAQKTQMPLIIAAKVDPDDQTYFETAIKPRLVSPLIHWIGEVDEQERNRLMSNALAFLHPVTFEEPFGLTLIEALACGCPVIAFKKGSIPEIIIDGKVGYVVETVNQMVEAVKNIHNINRKACRAHALSHFSATSMVQNYERLYYTILRNWCLD